MRALAAAKTLADYLAVTARERQPGRIDNLRELRAELVKNRDAVAATAARLGETSPFSRGAANLHIAENTAARLGEIDRLLAAAEAS
jgi:hypothetical protein